MTRLFSRMVGSRCERITRIVERLPLDASAGPWVAGGAARRLFEDVDDGKGDIDVFCANPDQKSHVEETLAMVGAERQNGQRALVSSFKLGGSTVQVVGKMFFENEIKLVEDFDFTVCQFVTDGIRVGYTAEAREDVRDKRLRLVPTAPYRNKAPIRLVKYAKLGFVPDPGVLSWCLNPVNRKDFSMTSWWDEDDGY